MKLTDVELILIEPQGLLSISGGSYDLYMYKHTVPNSYGHGSTLLAYNCTCTWGTPCIAMKTFTAKTLTSSVSLATERASSFVRVRSAHPP